MRSISRLGRWLKRAALRLTLAFRGNQAPPFTGSQRYWESRYALGGTSGRGSRDELAAFKATVLNTFVRQHGVATVVEFGCGDGTQLALADYPSYVGIDVSPTALALCRDRFSQDSTKRFASSGRSAVADGAGPHRAELALSLDVIFHLVEDPVFDHYMKDLFASATRFVIIYSTNIDASDPQPHIRHRLFTRWIEQHAPDWLLAHRVINPHLLSPDGRSGSPCNFYIFELMRMGRIAVGLGGGSDSAC